MTNKEYFQSLLGFAPGPNVADAAMLDAGINGSSTYVVSNSAALKTAAIQVMRVLLSTADTSNNVTGFSIKYDRAAILKLIALYEDDLGITAGRPIIKGRSVW
jgi:hypothetical protein